MSPDANPPPDPGRKVHLFSEVLQLPPSERPAFLAKSCAHEPALQREIEHLLEAHDEAGAFLEAPPVPPSGETRSGGAIGERPGDVIGRYKLLQQIGEGGCGVVFMAEQQEPVRRKVALKILKPGMDTRNVIARFEAERQALALMDHPNIAKVFDAGATSSGRPYFVMELVRGLRITDYCDQYALPTSERLQLFIQVCHAIQHAHQKGIIHRDIKPSNILVTTTAEGTPLPVVIDFGIAKASTQQRLTDKTLFTAFELLIGTPSYMSPEQAALTSVDVDTRSDIYSLGVLLYELLTGSPPFDTSSLLKSGLDEIRRVIREQEPVRPSTRLSSLNAPTLTTIAQMRGAEPPRLIRTVEGDLDWIALKALEKDRTRRYETAAGLAWDVQRYLANEAITARPPSRNYRLRKAIARNKVLFSAITGVASVLLVSLILVTASLTRERAATNELRRESVRSQQTTRLLKRMLEGVGPSVALGRDTTLLREILDQTAGRISEETAGQPAVELELRRLIGGLYFEIGNYREAELLQRGALRLLQQLHGTNSLETAAVWNDLGTILWKQRQLEPAETALLEALAVRRRLLSPQHPDVATTLNTLAGVYRRQGRLQQAESLAREALQIRQNHFGLVHLEVADSLHNLCVILGDLGRRAESEATARALLDMRRKLLKEDHPLVAAAKADVAWAAGFNGRTQEARTLELEAFENQRRHLGDLHPDVARSLSSLGERMRQQGDYDTAGGVLASALSIQRKVLGATHPETLATLRNLARSYEASRHDTEAEAVQRERLAVDAPSDTSLPGYKLEAAEGLVRLLCKQRRFPEALAFLNDNDDSRDSIPGFRSAALATTHLDLLARIGSWEQAHAKAASLVTLLPFNAAHFSSVAAVLATASDRTDYDAFCRAVIRSNAATTDPFVADQVAKASLLLPPDPALLPHISRLADRVGAAASSDPGAAPFFQFCKALAEYRQGHYPAALEWGQKARTGPRPDAESQALSVLAMAAAQLNDPTNARTYLERAVQTLPSQDPTGDLSDPGTAWLGRRIAQILVEEARRVVRSGEVPQQSPVAK